MQWHLFSGGLVISYSKPKLENISIWLSVILSLTCGPSVISVSAHHTEEPRGADTQMETAGTEPLLAALFRDILSSESF